MADPRPTSWLMIRTGWDVVGSGGKRIGRVARVLGDDRRDIFDGLIVGARLGLESHYVPAEKVARIREGQVAVDLPDLDAAQRYDEQAPGGV